MCLLLVSEQLKQIIKQYYDRMTKCESQKWDLEYEVRKRDNEVILFFWKKKKR